MASNSNLAIIVLAAGNSSRMGTSKQLLPIDGITLLERSVRCAMDSSAQNILVVLGARSKEHHTAIQHLPVSFAVNDNWEMGIGNSIKFGVRSALDRWPKTQPILIMVCDQPKLAATHINMLIDVWVRERPLAIASEYAGVTGVPAIFDKPTLSDLLKIGDTKGARELFEKFSTQLVRIPFTGGEVDLDTPTDYMRFLKEGN